MNDNLLQPIYNEKDLTTYERYINLPDFKTTKKETFSSFFNHYIGKNVKIYIAVGNQLNTRQGNISAIYDDFLILAQTREKNAIKLSEIKFISFT